MRWGYQIRGTFITKEAYKIWTNHEGIQADEVWKKVWKLNPLPKVASFISLVIYKQILIGENVQKRGWYCPFHCSFVIWRRKL